MRGDLFEFDRIIAHILNYRRYSVVTPFIKLALFIECNFTSLYVNCIYFLIASSGEVFDLSGEKETQCGQIKVGYHTYQNNYFAFVLCYWWSD